MRAWRPTVTARRLHCVTSMTMHVPSVPPLRAEASAACPLDSAPAESRTLLTALVFLQMLPATGIAPAIRPLFALHHAGRESAMHAFMAVNMAGAIGMALALAFSPDLRRRAAAWAPLLAVLDGVLLIAMTLPWPTAWVLALRTLEGALHVGVTTLLMSHAAEIARRTGDGRWVSRAGAAIIFAVASGSLLGGVLVGVDPRAAFWVGAGVLFFVASALRSVRLVWRASEPSAKAALAAPMAVPLVAAFLARFAVGCLVVSFSLFAHRVHHLSDRHVGFLYASLTVPFALAMWPVSALAKHRPNATHLALGMTGFAIAILLLGELSPTVLPFAMIGAGVASAFVFSAVLAFASAIPKSEGRGRAMALVNVAGCLGMVVGPAAGGIISAIFRDPSDVARGYRAVFLLAGGALAAWWLLAAPWLVRYGSMTAPRASERQGVR